MAVPRTVGTSKNLPGLGVRDASFDDEEQGAASIDHTHQLWSPWENIDPQGDWNNVVVPLAVCKISEMVMMRGVIENLGAALNTVCTLPAEYRPVNKRKLLRVRRVSTGAVYMHIETSGNVHFTDPPGFVDINVSADPIYIFNIIYRIDTT